MKSWWWVLLIWLGSFAFYEKEMREKMLLKKQLLLQRKTLKEQIESLSNPKWVERILIEELGRLPDGGVAVSFESHHTE